VDAVLKMPEFTTRDPRSPAFWDERFEGGFTPWDRGDAPQALRDFVARAGRPLRTLIPGCGSAYELAFLSNAGWQATAIDFSPAAVAAAREQAGEWSDRIVEADFFAYRPSEPLELIYERAFLCALAPAMRAQVAARWGQLLGPGNLLAGYFYFDDAMKGRPFGIGREELAQLLAPHFALVADEPVDDSVAVFSGKERWMVWRRLG
jgi:SAM-dependent methyltransferase